MPDYSFVWRGDKLEQDVFNAMLTALNAAAREAEVAIRSNTPVDTGFLRDSTYVQIDVSEQDEPMMIAGQTADYALYVELGTRFMDGHYQITQAMNEIVPTLPTRISNALADAGWGGGGSAGTEGTPAFEHD